MVSLCEIVQKPSPEPPPPSPVHLRPFPPRAFGTYLTHSNSQEFICVTALQGYSGRLQDDHTVNKMIRMDFHGFPRDPQESPGEPPGTPRNPQEQPGTLRRTPQEPPGTPPGRGGEGTRQGHSSGSASCSFTNRPAPWSRHDPSRAPSKLPRAPSRLPGAASERRASQWQPRSAPTVPDLQDEHYCQQNDLA